MICDSSIDIKIIPILVGAIDENKEILYGQLLAPYLARDDTFTVVSSDFCHWYASGILSQEHYSLILTGAPASGTHTTIRPSKQASMAMRLV